MKYSTLVIVAMTMLGACATKTPASGDAAASSTATAAASSAAATPASTQRTAAEPADKSKASEKNKPAESNRKEVKGINDWTGYIEGKPVKNSKFTKLKIGMNQKEVVDLIGAPTDQSGHVTGKAFIPFYHGSGKYEIVLYYKNHGRLYFAGGAGYSSTVGLVGIQHDGSEKGYAR